MIPSDYADEGGVPIAFAQPMMTAGACIGGWVEAVRPIADTLRKLAAHVIGQQRPCCNGSDNVADPADEIKKRAFQLCSVCA